MVKNNEIIQYRKVLEIEFIPDTEKTRIYHQGGEARYVTVNSIKMRPSLVKAEKISIRKQGTKVRFADPINCNIESGRFGTTMKCGVEFQGRDKRVLVEKIAGDMSSEPKPIWEEFKKDKKPTSQDEDDEYHQMIWA